MIYTDNLTRIFKRRSEGGRQGPQTSNPSAETAPGLVMAVDHANLKIEKGEVYGLVGPNGAGKTTLVKLLSTLILPTSGTATVNGHDVSKEGPAVRASIGLSVGNERSFYFRLSGEQNLEFFGALQGLSHDEIKKKTPELLKELDLYEARKEKFMKYSTGMMKKLNLARALLTDPPIILLDEPTAATDPYSASKIRSIISDLKNEGRTILLTSHNMHEVERASDRVGVINHGKLIAEDTPTALKGLLKKCIVKIELKSKISQNFADKIRNLEEVDKIDISGFRIEIVTANRELVLNKVVQFLSADGVEVTNICVEQPSLEEVFIDLTRRKVV